MTAWPTPAGEDLLGHAQGGEVGLELVEGRGKLHLDGGLLGAMVTVPLPGDPTGQFETDRAKDVAGEPSLAEMTAKVAKMRCRIYEVPISLMDNKLDELVVAHGERVGRLCFAMVGYQAEAEELSAQKQEIQRLKAENKRLKEERDILKKAAAYLSRDPD